MIGRIAGILLEKNPPQILVDCSGIAYEIDVPMSTFYNLPAIGEKVLLHTHLAIREDAHVLFGFSNPEERTTFRQLIKISGVGTRTALSILSGMPVADLAQAVTLQETGRLIKVPGIGKKTAQRIILELKGKIVEAEAPVSANDDPAVLALKQLGFTTDDARKALKDVDAKLDTQDRIRLALKGLHS